MKLRDFDKTHPIFSGYTKIGVYRGNRKVADFLSLPSDSNFLGYEIWKIRTNKRSNEIKIYIY